MKKRLLAGFMACALVLSLLPTAAFAASGDVSYLTCDNTGQNWTTETVSNPTTVTANDTAWTDGGWYVASGTVTIGQRVTVTGDVHLILEDGCNITINGGISVNEGNSITIYAQSEGGSMGELTANGTNGAYNIGASAGIGGDGGIYVQGVQGKTAGTITIYGGRVTANGGNGGSLYDDSGQAAGIGGGGGGHFDGLAAGGAGGTVNIYGGYVKTTGGKVSFIATQACGIGGGYNSYANNDANGGTINITGGTLSDTTTSTSGTFKMTGGTLDNCKIQNATATTSGNSIAIKNSTVNGTVTVSGNAEFEGTLTFNGAVSVNNASFTGSIKFVSGATITGSATLSDSTELTGDMTISAGGSLTNSGTLTVPTGSTITSHGTITNNEGATINLSGTINDTAAPYGTLTNNGTIFLISDGRILDSSAITPNAPVPSGTSPIPAGEIVIDLSTVTSTVTIGPKEYTIDGTSHAYDPARNNIVLTGTYGGNVSSIDYNPAAAVTVLENTTTSITLRNVNIGWEKDNTSQCSSIWAKDNCAVTVFLEGNNTLKPKHYGCGIRTEERSSLTVEGTGTLNLDLSNSSTIVGIGQCGSSTTGKFGSITINGGNIVTTVGTSHEWVAGIGGTHGTITVNGGTIMGGKFLNGMNLIPGADYEVVINGGTINIVDNTTDTYNASGHVGHGSLTINGGVVSMPWLSTYGKDGSITINGGQVTTTHSNGYLSYTAVINGGIVTGKISVDGNNKVKINGGSAKLTQYVYNSEGETIASVSNSDGKTAYRTVLTGQGSVADLLVDGKSQNISYNHPDDPAGTADNNLYLYLVHDENAATPETHTVVVMYQDGTRKEYTATWSGDPTNAFTFGDGQDSTPTTSKDIGMTMTGTTTNTETGKPEKTYGDAVPVVVTVKLTTQTTNALPPANGPMLAAANSLPYAFKTVILLCTDKDGVTREIERKDVPENQTSVVFYVQTQAWTPGEYKFTATYGGDASTGSSAIAATDAKPLKIVGQTLDVTALNLNFAVSGTYGQKVSELTASVKQGDADFPGKAEISYAGTDGANAVLGVGTTEQVTLTFTASGKGYAPVTMTVTPTISKATPTVTAPTAASSLTYNGSAQNLLSAGGTTTGGELQYSTDNSTWSTTIPTGTDAKSYTVYYKVVGGTNYNDVAAQSISPVTIAQKSISGAIVTVSGSPTYTGAAVEPAVTVTLDGNQLTATTDYTVSYTGNTAVGNNSATATVTGTGNYTGTASANFSIDKATPTVSVNVSMSGDAGSRQAEVTVTVTGVTGGAAPTGTVTLTGDSNSLSNPPTLSNGTASYTWTGLTDGEHKIKATYNGDGNYGTADSAETTFNTSKQGQSITISPVGNKTYGDPAFTLSVSGGSGNGAVTFESSDPTVISISGATATIHKAGGPVTITAKKAEDTTYNEATATLNITVAKKAVVFKANDKTVQQGGTMPTFDYAAVTLAQGDTITTEPTATCTAANTNTVGTFTITFSGAVLSSPDNYEVSYQPGTLTITAKPSTGGGGGGSYTPPTYKPDITKPSGGGDTPGVTPSNPKPGDTVTVTPKPDDGHEVGGITVTDKNGKPVEVTKKPDGTYTFKQPNGKVTIDVTYRPIGLPWNNPFSDVSESDWFYEAVKFVHQRGLMNGYSDGRFGPNDNLSRAQLAQILFNKEGRPGVNYLLTFSDVAGEAWYTEAIRWATSQGIVGGYGNGMFGPNDPITREQLAVMLWRYVGSPAATDKELHFADADEISGFALEAMRWAVENGILNGYGDGRLGPQGQATRAQVAQMLKNFIEKQEEENT